MIQEGSYLPSGRWRGLDLSRLPDDIGPGYLSVADNCQLSGEDIITRPGALGQLTTALGNPIRAFSPFGTGSAVFVSNGKLYKWDLAGASATEILKGGLSLSLVSNSVQVALTLGVAYLVDGTSALLRTDETTATETTELNRPSAPTATLSSVAILSGVGLLTWAQNYITGSSAVPGASGGGDTIAPYSSIINADANFWDGSNLTGRAFWNFEANATCSPNVLDANGDNCVELDSNAGTNEYVESDPMLLNAANVSGYARVAVAEYEAAAEDTNQTSEVVDLIVTAYSDTGGTAQIGQTRDRSPHLSEAVATRVRKLIDLRNLATAPRSIKLKWIQPWTRGSNKGTDVNRAALYVPRQELSITGDTDGRLMVRQGSVQVWSGLGSQASSSNQVEGSPAVNTSPPGRLLTAGLTLTTTITSVNLTGLRTVAAELFPGAGVSGLTVRLGFYNNSNTTWYYSDPLDVPTEGGWSVADIRAVAASLTAVTQLRVEILDDVLIEGLQDGGTSTVLRLGEIRNVGNLPEGQAVWYKLVEMDDAGDSSALLNVVWSDGSPSTPLLEATRGDRMGRLVIPARTNSGAEYLALYRFGGSFIQPGQVEDPVGRLVCLIAWSAGDFAFGSDTDKGSAPRIVAFANPYVSWDKTGSTGDAGSILIDNTPDSWLTSADTYLSGREKAPSAPAAVAAWDSRLWLASGADLYASWRLEGSATAGIYWSRLQLPESTDPEASRKGHWERLLLPVGDSIQRLIPLPDALVILTTQSVFVATIVDNAVPRYLVRRLYDADASGLVAPLAACEFENRCWWVAKDGIRASDGQSVQRIAPELGTSLFSGDLSGSVLSACPTSRRVLAYLASSLYVFCAGREEDSDLERGWFRWTLSAKAGADIGGALHLAGENGQVFKMTGAAGDKATPAASATAIAFAVTTRRAGTSGVVSQPGYLSLHVETTGAETLAITVAGASSNDSDDFTQTISGAGTWDWSRRVSRACQGPRMSVALSCSAAKELKVLGVALDAVPKRKTR